MLQPSYFSLYILLFYIDVKRCILPSHSPTPSTNLSLPSSRLHNMHHKYRPVCGDEKSEVERTFSSKDLFDRECLICIKSHTTRRDAIGVTLILHTLLL